MTTLRPYQGWAYVRRLPEQDPAVWAATSPTYDLTSNGSSPQEALNALRAAAASQILVDLGNSVDPMSHRLDGNADWAGVVFCLQEYSVYYSDELDSVVETHDAFAVPLNLLINTDVPMSVDQSINLADQMYAHPIIEGQTPPA